MSETAAVVAHEPTPAERVMQMVGGKWISMAVGVAADLGVADHLAGRPGHGCRTGNQSGSGCAFAGTPVARTGQRGGI